jgi:hypothetical protein
LGFYGPHAKDFSLAQTWIGGLVAYTEWKRQGGRYARNDNVVQCCQSSIVTGLAVMTGLSQHKKSTKMSSADDNSPVEVFFQMHGLDNELLQ